MFKKEEYELFKKYCQINAISSYENKIARVLIKEYKDLGYEIIKDNLGNLFAYKKSKVKNAYKVLIDGHMDEVGFIVRWINDNGLINVHNIGSISIDAIKGTRFLLTSSDNKEYVGAADLNGIKKDASNISDVKFDFGFKSKQDALDHNIQIGDMISFIGPTLLINDANRLISKAIDNRYSIVLGIELLRYFKDKDLPFDLYIGASVDEEVGARGAKVIPNHIKPDIVIVLDCSNANANSGNDGKIGDGVLIRYLDYSMIARPLLLQKQVEALENVNAKYQYFRALGGTDAGSFHVANEGIKTLTHCICGNNIHTANTIIDSDDYQGAKNSLINLVENLSVDDIENILKNA